MPGMLIAARCRDLAEVVFKGSRSAACRGCPVTGHLPVDEIYFSMAEASKTCPDLTETTGLAGEVPLKAQNMKVCGFFLLSRAPPTRRPDVYLWEIHRLRNALVT